MTHVEFRPERKLFGEQGTFSEIYVGTGFLGGENRRFVLKRENERRKTQSIPQEIRALRLNQGGKTVGILGDGRRDGRREVYLEWIPDASPVLRYKMKHGLDLVDELELTTDMAEGLVHVHGNSTKPPYVHNDIGPGNYIVTSDGKVKLIDFASSFNAHRVPPLHRAHVSGTRGYIAPEKYTGEPSQAADVFALGMLAADVLGSRFSYNDPQNLGLEPAPVVVEDAILSAISKNPRDRPSARAFADTLGSFVPHY